MRRASSLRAGYGLEAVFDAATVSPISDTVVTREAILFVVVSDQAVASFVVRHLLMVKGGRQ